MIHFTKFVKGLFLSVLCTVDHHFICSTNIQFVDKMPDRQSRSGWRHNVGEKM